LGLDAAGCANAISIGAALAPWCPAEVFFGVGGTIKPMLFGAVPACAGIKAAHYARAGFNGPKAILESPIGFYSTISHHPEPDKTADFDTWYLLAPRRKLHACCGYIHSALDNLIAMRTEGVAVADAAEINVGIPAYTFPAVSKPDLPATANEARFHLAYCLAVATTGAELISPAHCVDVAQWIDRPDVAAAIRKIRISVDPELSHYHQSTIAMHGAGGGSSYRSNEAPRGAPGNPMSDEEVRGKFRRLASGRFPETTVEFALEQILSLETRRDLSALMAALILPCPR
jgi:2-methylcitrate dehydratase PrpD